MSPLSTSDKVLDEDVIKRPPREFSPTFLEWVSDNNAEQILISKRSSGAGTIILYTVPDNFSLFITSAFLAGHSTTVANNHGDMFLHVDQGAERAYSFLGISIDHHTGTSVNSNALNYPMPLRVFTGQVVKVTIAIDSGVVIAGFQGFLLPKKISIR